MPKRYFTELSYDGSDFHGWQIQQNAKSIQETLNSALSTLLRTEIYVVGCGRTDTGVHASFFVAHFDMEQPLESPSDLCYRVNRILPPSIAMHRVYEVSSDAHARFSAERRSYAYRITQQKDPFAVLRKWEMRDTLDIDAMNEAAATLIGSHDFTSFSKSNTQTETNLCTVYDARWIQEGKELKFEISANRFLRNMVRAIVGTLVQVGRGEMEVGAFQAVIDAKNRSEAGLSVPAHGLYLTHVSYPEGMIQ